MVIINKISYFNYINNINTNFHNFHIFQSKFIINIFRNYGFNIIDQSLKIKDFPLDQENFLEKFINNFNFKENENVLFIFNSLDYYLITNNITKDNKENFITFLKKINYITFHYENFINNNLEQIGYPSFNGTCNNKNNILINHERSNFQKLFFKNSLLNIIQSSNNVNIFKSINILNYMYHPCLGYSEINKYIPLEENNIKDIDILFYGNGLNVYEYRTNIYNEIKTYCDDNKINLVYKENLYDNKNDFLKRSKIVLHIPISKQAQIADCWCKISELMCKKIFFITEENNDMIDNKTINLFITYKHGNIEELINKINFYLDIKNSKEKNKIIDNCYKYIKNNYNMDNCIKSLSLLK